MVQGNGIGATCREHATWHSGADLRVNSWAGPVMSSENCLELKPHGSIDRLTRKPLRRRGRRPLQPHPAWLGRSPGSAPRRSRSKMACPLRRSQQMSCLSLAPARTSDPEQLAHTTGCCRSSKITSSRHPFRTISPPHLVAETVGRHIPSDHTLIPAAAHQEIPAGGQAGHGVRVHGAPGPG